ncbi:MAG: polyphosphate kinase 1 [Burkholderiaceae bacterium]
MPDPLDREAGVLAFNERLMCLAEDKSVPLLERLRFLTIVSNNLDEFFEIRVAELKELQQLDTVTGVSIGDKLDAIAARTNALLQRQYQLLNQELLPALREQGIALLEPADWSEAHRTWATRVFEAEIEPLLTPIALDPVHPFPRISNKNLNWVVELEGRDAFGRRPGLAIVQAPRALPRMLRVPLTASGSPHDLMLLTAIVQGMVGRLFPGLEVRSLVQFRLTRNSELYVDEEEMTNLRTALRSELRQRHFGDGVRLEVSAGASDTVVERLRKEFELDRHDCYTVDGPVNLMRLNQILDLVDRPDLKFPVLKPALPAGLRKKALFAAIARHDILMHHPYESFEPVVVFLRSATSDPQVVSIKMSIYRTGADSLLMESLLEAARAGKEVTVVVELMARFDEEANINWAAKLESVGAHVVYGVVGHKTHAKLALILRRENGVLKRYAHLGTGNYHPRTALSYEDFGCFTADPQICQDVQEVFRRLTGLGVAGKLLRLLQAPFELHGHLLASIEREAAAARAGRKALIRAKVNALLEPRIIQALYAASQAGVKIELIVRGVCAIRPGIAGLSENIRVISVLGRFLEHSRVYYFWADGDEAVWLGSADWMNRNFFRRVEVAFPVREKKLKNRVIDESFRIPLDPSRTVWEMDADGNYRLLNPQAPPESGDPQRLLLERLASGRKVEHELEVDEGVVPRASASILGR